MRAGHSGLSGSASPSADQGSVPAAGSPETQAGAPADAAQEQSHHCSTTPDPPAPQSPTPDIAGAAGEGSQQPQQQPPADRLAERQVLPPGAQPTGTSGQERQPKGVSGLDGRGPEGGAAPQQPDAPAAQAADLQTGPPSVPRPALDPPSGPLPEAAQHEEAGQAAGQQAGAADWLASLAPSAGLHSHSAAGRLGSAASAQVLELSQAAVMSDRCQLQTVACQLTARVNGEIALRDRLRSSDVEEVYDLQELAASTGKISLVCPICGRMPFLSYVRCRCRLVPAVCLPAHYACLQAPVRRYHSRAANQLSMHRGRPQLLLQIMCAWVLAGSFSWQCCVGKSSTEADCGSRAS